MIRKKIYIAGCAGMLGEAFIKKFYEDYFNKSIDIINIVSNNMLN